MADGKAKGTQRDIGAGGHNTPRARLKSEESWHEPDTSLMENEADDGDMVVPPINHRQDLTDGFAAHKIDIEVFGYRREDVDNAEIQHKVLGFSFSGLIQSAVDFAQQHGLDSLYCENPERYEEIRIKQISFVEISEHMSHDWYMMQIYLHWERFERERNTTCKDKMGPDSFYNPNTYHAVMLGAICREFQLSTVNKTDASRGRLDHERRREGGRLRVREDHDQIVSEMQTRIDKGQSIRQAARAVHDRLSLGASATANESLYKRARGKKSDRS